MGRAGSVVVVRRLMWAVGCAEALDTAEPALPMVAHPILANICLGANAAPDGLVGIETTKGRRGFGMGFGAKELGGWG
eukprot:3804793-Karenia_brevis.AAC.1